MLEKKLVPKLRFAEFDGVWEVKKLQDRCVFFAGGTPTSTKKEYYNGNIPFIGSGNIFDEKVYKFITEEAFSNSSAKIVNQGDILYALYGANSGEVSISKISGAINQAILCIRTEEEKGFLFQILSHKKNRIVSTYLQGGQGNLSSQIIKKLKLNFPSLPEQQKIASFLTEVDTKLSQLTKKKALLEDYKKGVTQQIFSQELRFKDGNGNDYGDWEEKMLGEILDYEQPTKYIVESTEYENSFKTPVLTAGKTFILGYTDENQGVFTNLPVIIFDDFTMANKYVNFAFKVKSSAMKILKPNSVDVNIKFIYESIQMINYPKGDEHKRFWISEYSKIKIGYPSLEEQTKIANFLSELDTKIEVLSTSIENTQTFKKGLLQQLFV
jgi:type I restriction enzyme S subunit